MFRRSRPGARRARRARSDRPTLLGRRKPLFELLEDRRLLAVFTVTSNFDTVDNTDGVITLREAIALANVDPATFDTVNFAPALNAATIQLTNVGHAGQLSITGNMEIDATSLPNFVSIKAFDASAGAGDGARIFNIDDGNDAATVFVGLTNLRLTGGDVVGAGGAILSKEDLTINNSIITGNRATTDGGAIFSSLGTLNMSYTRISLNTAVTGGGLAIAGNKAYLYHDTFTTNTATDRGGAIIANAGTLKIGYSTIGDLADATKKNVAQTNGGAGVFSTASTTITDTTIALNEATGPGGGLRLSGGTQITGSTITGNTSTTNGGGLFNSGANINIESTTIDKNVATTNGGGIFQDGNVFRFYTSSVTNNKSNFGGGVYLHAVTNALITNVTIATNIANLSGGGLWTNTGTIMVLRNSTISGNSSALTGGGFNTQASSTAIINSTISGNTTNGIGGGIFAAIPVDRSMNIQYSTITKNISNLDAVGGGAGGGIYLGAGTGVADLRNTIVAGNNDFTNIAPDIDNTSIGTAMLTANFTLIGNNKGTGPFAGASNIVGTLALPINPLLGPLQNNGGPTKTHSLLPGSMAINFGDPAAVAGVGNVPALDQRGTLIDPIPTIQPFLRVADGRLDIGAFEFQQPPTAPTMQLLASSDSGMFNNDGVTNKMQPAFGGFGPISTNAFIPATVLVYAQRTDANGDPAGDPFVIGTGTVGPDASDGFIGNGLGVWEVTVEPLADGKYNFFARFDTPVTPDDGAVTHKLSDPVAMSPIKFSTIANKAIPANGVATSIRVIPAPVAPLMPSFVADINISVDISFPRDGDLVLTLVSPSGTSVVLSNRRGGNNPDFFGTRFDDAANTKIQNGTAPFNGIFIPDEPLATFQGEHVEGNWTLFVTNAGGQTGTINGWTLTITPTIMVEIDTVAPNTPNLDLVQDTGRNDADNVTQENNPFVKMTTSDTLQTGLKHIFTDNLKYRIYDRFNSSIAAEILIYDSAQDVGADSLTTAGDMFTSSTLLQVFLPVLQPSSPAIVNGRLADGVHNLKLVVEDRAGNLTHDFQLTITVDTKTPPISFGLPDTGSPLTPNSATDGLKSESDSGVTTVPATYADRITRDTTPTLWGRAEANTIVRVYFDKNNDGIIQLNGPLADPFLGQVTAIPLDGNNADPEGYWELTSALDLNQIAGLPKDGLRQLLATAEDVAGNPSPTPGIGEGGVILNPAILDIFIDTQGPQITDVTVNDLTSAQYKLFDPKPTTSGPTPPVTSLTIAIRDLPNRVNNTGAVNDFLYDALVKGIAVSPGNYVLKGDRVGNIAIKTIEVVNSPLTALLTAVTNAGQFTAAGLIGETINPGDFVLFSSGVNEGQFRQVTTFNKLTGEFTFAVPFGAAPAVGDGIRVAPTLSGAQSLEATAKIKLTFFAPLPDDRYTLTVKDSLVDPANNKLDGESNASEPQEMPTFPSGDGVPGGNFVARFSIDSHPEIGNYVSQNINIDINGNFVWDPANAQLGGDAHNVDISFTLPVKDPATGNIGLGGFNVHDLLTVGKFRPKVVVNPDIKALVNNNNFFDQLAAYGNSAELGGIFRWLVDTNSDGVINTADGDIIQTQGTLPGFNSTARAGAIPVAGDFDRNRTNGDEIGLYYAGIWAVDTNHDYVIDRVYTGSLLGTPIVGDFDGNGFDDLGVFRDNTFFIDLSFIPAADSTVSPDTFFVWGFPGVLDRPVAADMDGDGIDDVGLWVPRTDASLPQGVAQWYFLLSNDFSAPGVPAVHVGGNVNKINHPFTPTPFGFDIFAEFGDERSMPIVGNFDPPTSHLAGLGATAPIPGDYDGNGMVDLVDYNILKSTFNSKTNLAADGNHNGVIDSGDFAIWSDNKGHSAFAHAAAAQVVAPAGDFNGSGGVDAADLSVYNSSFDSTSNLAADANGNGIVDAADYTRWRDNLGTGTSGSGGGGGGGSASETVVAAAAPQASLLAAIPALSPASADSAGASPVLVGATVAASADNGSLLLLAARAESSDAALGQYGDGSANLTGNGSGDDTTSTADTSALAVAWQSWDQL